MELLAISTTLTTEATPTIPTTTMSSSPKTNPVPIIASYSQSTISDSVPSIIIEAATPDSGSAFTYEFAELDSETAPQVDSNAEPLPQVQYIPSGKPTGLAAMANAVREYDDERVKNCKEDIDTLLVFVSIL